MTRDTHDRLNDHFGTDVLSHLTLASISPAQLTANTDNWNPTGLASADAIRASTDASRNLTGIVAPSAAKLLLLINIGTHDLVLKHDATSTAANRFFCPGDVDLTVTKGTGVLLAYDTTSVRWQVIGMAGGGGGGGSITVELLGGTGGVGSVSTLRVAQFTNNGGGDVSLLPNITGTGTGSIFFASTSVNLLSPDGDTSVVLKDSAFAGDIANNGLNIEVGPDGVGLWVSEKDSATVQIYPDSGGGYDIELKDQGSGKHWKLVTADGLGVAIPSMGMLPQYSSAPHSGTETEGESYYDTTLHKARTWNGSSWNAWW